MPLDVPMIRTVGSVDSIALSGLSAQSLRLTVSANNVANLATNGFQPSRVDATADASGGVATTVQQLSNPAVESQLNGTLVALSGTDQVAEVATQILAVAAFRANLKVLEAAQAMDRAVGAIGDPHSAG